LRLYSFMAQSVAFIFDMDGVIVDSNPFHKKALQQFCRKYGYELGEEELRTKIYGRTNKDWITNLFGELPAETLKKYAHEKEALFRELYDKDVKLVDGFRDFLVKLDSNKISRAIATSAPRENVDFTISKTSIQQFFSVILDDSFVTVGKPDPEVYLKSAKALNHAPNNCIVFEDSLSGVKAGKNAGCKVVGITTTHTPEELHEADYIIKNFVQLEPGDLISKLFE
jgi:beta-phosphoglucomutase